MLLEKILAISPHVIFRRKNASILSSRTGGKSNVSCCTLMPSIILATENAPFGSSMFRFSAARRNSMYALRWSGSVPSLRGSIASSKALSSLFSQLLPALALVVFFGACGRQTLAYACEQWQQGHRLCDPKSSAAAAEQGAMSGPVPENRFETIACIQMPSGSSQRCEWYGAFSMVLIAHRVHKSAFVSARPILSNWPTSKRVSFHIPPGLRESMGDVSALPR